MKNRILFSLLVVLLVLLWVASNGSAQTIQLPTIGSFNVNSAVSVPDGGTALLGGVSRSASGSINRGVPGLSNVPFVNRGFGNGAIGRETSRSTASVHTKLIIMKEYEAQVLAEAERRAAIARRFDRNGTQQAQKKADFISRNIGRFK